MRLVGTITGCWGGFRISDDDGTLVRLFFHLLFICSFLCSFYVFMLRFFSSGPRCSDDLRAFWDGRRDRVWIVRVW